jgi:hypothetical protein
MSAQLAHAIGGDDTDTVTLTKPAWDDRRDHGHHHQAASLNLALPGKPLPCTR